MPRVAKGMKAFTIALEPETYGQLKALADRLGRPVQVEAVCAIGRHLESPPTIREPTLKPLALETPATTPAPARSARKPTPPPKAQKAAERRTLALAALEDGTTRVSLRDEWSPPPALEDSVQNADA